MLAHRLLAAYVVVCLAAITWPVNAWVTEHVEITILGLPFVFAWNVLWVVASFVVLVAYYRAVREGGRG